MLIYINNVSNVFTVCFFTVVSNYLSRIVDFHWFWILRAPPAAKSHFNSWFYVLLRENRPQNSSIRLHHVQKSLTDVTI